MSNITQIKTALARCGVQITVFRSKLQYQAIGHDDLERLSATLMQELRQAWAALKELERRSVLLEKEATNADHK